MVTSRIANYHMATAPVVASPVAASHLVKQEATFRVGDLTAFHFCYVTRFCQSCFIRPHFSSLAEVLRKHLPNFDLILFRSG